MGLLTRKALQKNLGREAYFQWRGGSEVSRIEGLSDAVFGFSITLLVVSLEVPKTFDELWLNMQGFVAFAASFALLLLVWYNQYLYFRRYNIQDTTTFILTAALLFVVLFYIYPLKFLFTVFFSRFLGVQSNHVVLQAQQYFHLLIIYSVGFGAVSIVFLCMYLHAYRLRYELELTEIERYATVTSIGERCIDLFVAWLSIGITLFASPSIAVYAAFSYFLLGPLHGTFGFWRGKRRKPLEQPYQ